MPCIFQHLLLSCFAVTEASYPEPESTDWQAWCLGLAWQVNQQKPRFFTFLSAKPQNSWGANEFWNYHQRRTSEAKRKSMMLYPKIPSETEAVDWRATSGFAGRRQLNRCQVPTSLGHLNLSSCTQRHRSLFLEEHENYYGFIYFMFEFLQGSVTTWLFLFIPFCILFT